jgi:hypothetical protein
VKRKVALSALLILVSLSTRADQRDKAIQAADLILKLCLAGGFENVEIRKEGSSLEVTGKNLSLQIDRKAFGLVGGISKEITALSGQQASEARSCTQKYLGELVNILLKDEPGDEVRRPDRAKSSREASVVTDPEAFWSGTGIWQDNQNYCRALLEFLSATGTPSNFTYADNGQRVSLDTIPPPSKPRRIEGNYIIRTETGSRARFCEVFHHDVGVGYDAISCSREVANGRPEIFASVYNQTLKDIRDCLLPAGWTQRSSDQGVCLPEGTTRGERVRQFRIWSRSVWLYSNFEEGSKYTVGIQTELGRRPQ